MATGTLPERILAVEAHLPALRPQSANVVSGLLAGMAATLPMTIGMVLLHRFLPGREKANLPPVTITNQAVEKTHAPQKLKNSTLTGVPLAAHYGYGAVAGALYGPAIAWPAPAAVKGVAMGLLVWTTSYLGLMPALHLYPSAKDEPARMNGLMIAAHVVWGGVTGFLAERLAQTLQKSP